MERRKSDGRRLRATGYVLLRIVPDPAVLQLLGYSGFRELVGHLIDFVGIHVTHRRTDRISSERQSDAHAIRLRLPRTDCAGTKVVAERLRSTLMQVLGVRDLGEVGLTLSAGSREVTWGGRARAETLRLSWEL